MPRDVRLYFDDILTGIERIRKYTASMDSGQFAGDEKTFDAVIRNLEIIGEAARSIPDDVKAGNPEVEWKKIIAFRNILAHEYFGVSPAIVWDVVTSKLTGLEKACKIFLES